VVGGKLPVLNKLKERNKKSETILFARIVKIKPFPSIRVNKNFCGK